MARGNITVVKSVRGGVALAAEANGDPANNHQYVNDGQTRLIVRNASADTPYDLTIHVARDVDGQPADPRVIEIPANVTWTFGPYPIKDYGRLVLVDVENANLKLRCLA